MTHGAVRVWLRIEAQVALVLALRFYAQYQGGWVAHISFDRRLGFGLQYPTGVGDTHLGRVGGRRPIGHPA